MMDQKLDINNQFYAIERNLEFYYSFYVTNVSDRLVVDPPIPCPFWLSTCRIHGLITNSVQKTMDCITDITDERFAPLSNLTPPKGSCGAQSINLDIVSIDSLL